MHYYKSDGDAERGVVVGQLIMLGTLFGLIVLIFGLVIYFDPDARGRTANEEQTANHERDR